jgi:glycerol-3-phosphate responsive antiterminator
MDLDKYTDVSMAQLQLMFNSMPDSEFLSSSVVVDSREKKKKKKKKKKKSFSHTDLLLFLLSLKMQKEN